MKNIHILPTVKPSSLIIYNSKLKLVNYPVITPSGNQKHVYITSDEEIKEGDWCIEYDDIDKKWLNLYKPTNKSWDMVSKANYCRLRGTVKKIILTTDQDLIDDGVQAIADEFLEWFIKNPNCMEIEVVDVRSLGVYGSYYPYKIIIPKEDIKQETLEEAAERIFDGFGDITKPVVIKRAIELVKCQQEKMYSEEEVLKIIDLLFHKYASSFRVDAKEDFLLSKKK